MLNCIKYLSFYSLNPKDNSAAADTKVKYISHTLEILGYTVDLISANSGRNTKIVDAHTISLSDKTRLISFKQLPNGNFVKRFIRNKFNKYQLKKYLKYNLKNDDTIIIYHSLYYYKLYKWIKKHSKAKIILEVEEIYSDVNKVRFITRDKEVKSFSYADAFIFPSKLLNDHINVKNKPFTIIYGTYNIERHCGQSFNDGRIHVVYAGTFDPRKGGVAAAAAAAQFLTVDYHVHILGFGTDIDTKNLIKTIKEVSMKTDCLITYDGLKSGDDYIKFIQSCDIGLSTQNPDAAFNATSFPSKILSYMSNGLRVVSIRIPAVEESFIGRYMYYYDNQTPEEIAKAIKGVDLNDSYDSIEVIKDLDKDFKFNINRMIKELNDEN